MHPRDRLVWQQHLVDQSVEGAQIRAIDPQKIIGIPGHRPRSGDLGAGMDQLRKAGRMFGAVNAQMDLYKALNTQPQARRTQARDIAFDIPFILQPLTATPDLAGRQVQITCRGRRWSWPRGL